MNERLRSAAAGSAVGLTLALGFPDSMGLWPLRLIASWPAELGRALGNLLTAGRFSPLALGQGPDLQLLAASAPGRALAATLGLAFQLGGALALLWLAGQPRWPRRLFAALALAGLVAAFSPPSALVTTAELGAALACAILAAVPQDGPRALALALIAGTAGTAPLAELRPVLLDTGRAQGAIATLEPTTGIAASAFALLAFALFAAGAYVLFRSRAPIASAAPPSAAEPGTVSPP